ncbi:Major facilitator superfamily domain-containing protein 4, partial [Stegodyphus mimosarum]
MSDWGNVMFTDESRFDLEPDDKRITIWHEQRTRNQAQNITEHQAFRGGSIMVWAGISLRYRTDLHIFKRGSSLTAVRYRDEVLEIVVRLYAAAVGPAFVLMDDNARLHKADIVDDYLESEGIARMAWPAYSPDLNPIENDVNSEYQAPNELQPGTIPSSDKVGGSQIELGSALRGFSSVATIPTKREHFYQLLWANKHVTGTLCAVFWSFGMCVAFLGPVLFDLGCKTDTVFATMSWVFFSQSLFVLLGSAIGGILVQSLNIMIWLFCPEILKILKSTQPLVPSIADFWTSTVYHISVGNDGRLEASVNFCHEGKVQLKRKQTKEILLCKEAGIALMHHMLGTRSVPCRRLKNTSKDD